MDLRTAEKFIEEQKESDLLEQLLSKVGGNIVVQFGPENKPSDPLNGVRISKISTPAGMQFRITSLDILLRETASQYVPTVEEAKKIAAARRKHYTRETPFRKLLSRPVVEKTWYLCDRPEDADRRNHAIFRHEIIDDSSVITLACPT
jgi:hypothetical protein